MTILGAQDPIELTKAGRTDPFPLDEISIFDDLFLSEQIDNMVISLQLNPFGTVEENMGHTKITYNSSTVGQQTEYIAYIIDGLERAEADGSNNVAGINAVDLFWDFFQKHSQ